MLLIVSCKSRLLDTLGVTGVNSLAPVLLGYQDTLASKGIESQVLFLDEADSTHSLGIDPSPVEPRMLAGKLREAHRTLNGKVSNILLLGGPEIVPFLSVPNEVPKSTVRDPDQFIITDNHYGCEKDDGRDLDPTLPVGRII